MTTLHWSLDERSIDELYLGLKIEMKMKAEEEAARVKAEEAQLSANKSLEMDAFAFLHTHDESQSEIELELEQMLDWFDNEPGLSDTVSTKDRCIPIARLLKQLQEVIQKFAL